MPPEDLVINHHLSIELPVESTRRRRNTAMKTAILLTTILTACAISPAPAPAMFDQRVDLYATPTDLAGNAWTLRPSDYLIDRPFHVTRVVSADGAALNLDATIPAGGAITVPVARPDLVIDGTGLASVEGWY
jgi:hypothetical protein